MLRSIPDLHVVPTVSQPQGLCIDAILARLAVPQAHRDTVWLRLEPLLRWSHSFADKQDARTFGVFVTWKRCSIERDVVDAMLIIDEATCLALRRACHGRRLLLVDNTCLPRDAAA
jgi:hypothetical protein